MLILVAKGMDAGVGVSRNTNKPKRSMLADRPQTFCLRENYLYPKPKGCENNTIQKNVVPVGSIFSSLVIIQ